LDAIGFELLQQPGQLLQGAAFDGIAGRAQLFEIGAVRENCAALVDQDIHRFAQVFTKLIVFQRTVDIACEVERRFIAH